MPDSLAALRAQLVEALTERTGCAGKHVRSKGWVCRECDADALLPLVSAALSAAELRGREQAAEAIRTAPITYAIVDEPSLLTFADALKQAAHVAEHGGRMCAYSHHMLRVWQAGGTLSARGAGEPEPETRPSVLSEETP